MTLHERDKDEIRHHIDTTFQAYIDRDWDALRIACVEEWAGFTVDAASIIRGSGTYILSVKRLLKDIDLIDYEMIEIDYAFYDPVCVVPYVARLRGTWVSGDTFEVKLRVLDLYARRDGTWYQVARSIALHPDTSKLCAHLREIDTFQT